VNRLHKDKLLFVIRIWVEPREPTNRCPVWRGVIKHVVSGETRYFTDLDSILGFIRAHLEKIGVSGKTDWWHKVWTRIKQQIAPRRTL